MFRFFIVIGLLGFALSSHGAAVSSSIRSLQIVQDEVLLLEVQELSGTGPNYAEFGGTDDGNITFSASFTSYSGVTTTIALSSGEYTSGANDSGITFDQGTITIGAGTIADAAVENIRFHAGDVLVYYPLSPQTMAGVQMGTNDSVFPLPGLWLSNNIGNPDYHRAVFFYGDEGEQFPPSEPNQYSLFLEGNISTTVSPSPPADIDRDTIPDFLDTAPGRNPQVADWMISAGEGHNCALDDDGVQCWGAYDDGQTAVPALSNPVAVSAGGKHSCALDDTGVVCWGLNGDGQTTVPTLSNPVAIETGRAHSCALDDSGVVCWGNNFYGSTFVPALSNPVAISAQEYDTCALDDTGAVCWGYRLDSFSAPALSNPVAVDVGGDHACALDDNGVACWGFNPYGQLAVPTLVNPVAVSAGSQHSCALDDSGLVCWGRNFFGQNYPPPYLDNPVAISAGWYHFCALDRNIGPVCWGYDADGRDQDFDYSLHFDKDLDGVPDLTDYFPLDPSESVDTNFDGEGNGTDLDDDGDGISDVLELGAGMDPLVDDGTRPTDDGDGDGVGLLDELINGSSDDNFDSDGDGLTDYFEIFVNFSDPGAVTNVASGDLNDNGEIDVGDMLLLQKMLLDPTQ
jgi:hypothetical protein